jgi:hypothetical protein
VLLKAWLIGMLDACFLLMPDSVDPQSVYLRLFALKAGDRPFLISLHQSLVLDVNRLGSSSSCASCRTREHTALVMQDGLLSLETNCKISALPR